MNRSPYIMLLIILFTVIVTCPVKGVASPVGNIGDPMLWNPGPFQKQGGLSLIVSVLYDSQTNVLPNQMTRFAWIKPNVSPVEERHYQQVRSSKNTLNTFGVKLGIPVEDYALVYALVGANETKINFHYKDWTVSRLYESHDTFESDPNAFWGLGTSIIMQRGEYRKLPLALGMDISYRRFSIEENRIADDGLSYSSTLDELQLAVCLSAQFKSFSPYFGLKVASITGTEDYINKNYATSYFSEGYIHYKQDITWSKNVGYFFGISTIIKELVSVGIEFRGGDENAMEFSATTRF